jgi:rhodanese-related sulfurtransferase
MTFFSQLVEFIGNHWFLFVVLAVIAGLLIQNLIVGSKGSVTPLQAVAMMNHRDAVVLDVRPAADYAKGHIIGALNIPMNGFSKQLATLNKYRDKPLIVSCRSGAQSSMACGQLRKAGFAEVFNLQGGVMAWESAGQPLPRSKKS